MRNTRRRHPAIILGLFLLFASPGLADVSGPVVDRVLQLSGLNRQVPQLPGLFQAGLEQAKEQGAPIPDEIHQVMLDSIEESISPSRILGEIGDALKTALTDEEMERLIDWYESDLGKRITQGEENASTPEAYREIVADIPSLLADRERVAFAERLDALLGSTDAALKIQAYRGLVSYTAVAAALYPDQPFDMDQYAAELGQQVEQVRPAVKRIVTATTVYAYRDVGMAELREYEDFLRTDAAAFNRTVQESMMRGLEHAIGEWGRAFSAKVGEMRGKPGNSPSGT